MSGMFLAPMFFAFLGLIPIVVLLYLLKLKRTPVVISSTMLWLRSLQDLTANAPFQRLRKNLLLLLQILILIALTIALARPFVIAEGAAGNNLCLLIDHSASMMTLESDGTRLEQAKNKALEMIDEMSNEDRMMIVPFAATAEVACELTNDRYRLREAVRNIEAVPTATKARDAFMVAHSLTGGAREVDDRTPTPQAIPDLHVVMISDGQIDDLDEIGARGFDMDFLQVGETADNTGIVAFSVRQPAEGASGQRQAFLLLHNDGNGVVNTTVTLTFRDEVLAIEEVAVPAQGDKEVVFAIGEIGAGVLKANLDYSDALSIDNEAWLALRPAPTIKTLLVAENDSTSAYFLKRVLLLEPRVELDNTTPENYLVTDKYDLVVFDNYAPDELPPGTLLFFNAAPPLDGVALGEEIERPAIVASDSEHPTMRFLNPSTVGILKARTMTVPSDARALWSGANGPLIADVSRQGRRIILAGFNLADTNWPWHLSFPLFIQNLLAWVPRSQLSEETYVAAGRPITVMPAQDTNEATITLPDGQTETIALEPTRPTFFGDTSQLGIYLVSRGDIVEEFAVNLLNAKESAVTPAESLALGRSEIAAQKDSVKQTRELWRWFVIAALAILMIEWMIFARRAWL